MSPTFSDIRVQGRTLRVPSVEVGDRTVVITGKWLKIASIRDENSLDGEVIVHPERFIPELQKLQAGADILTFPQRLPETKPKYAYPFEWDNAAVIPITTYDDWLARRAATDVRQNVKKAARRGIDTRTVPFDDEFVRGVVRVYNESRVRQGRPFWHYGKPFEVVKHETGHCSGKSIFIGAYLQDELVGFLKLLCASGTADIVLLVCQQEHFDKRPTNALIAKAVEVCSQKGIAYLTYAKYAYGKKVRSSLAEFKRRHGFECILFPRYYVPLTLTGKVATRLKLYRSFRERVPETLTNLLLKLRAGFYARWCSSPLKATK